jgi:hypothetical protein
MMSMMGKDQVTYQLINQGGFAMFTRDEFIIYVYCVVVQYFQRMFPTPLRHAGFAPALSDEEALTIELVGDYLEMESDKQIYKYFRKHYRDWFPNLPDRSTLVRQWQNLWRVKAHLWQAIVRDSGAWKDPVQLIDTLPLPVCHVRRASSRKIFLDDLVCQPSYGYCASKDWHYFGFKGGLRISSTGMILAAPILPASPHDIDLIDHLLLGVPSYTRIFGDKGFIDLEQQITVSAMWGFMAFNYRFGSDAERSVGVCGGRVRAPGPCASCFPIRSTRGLMCMVVGKAGVRVRVRARSQPNRSCLRSVGRCV